VLLLLLRPDRFPLLAAIVLCGWTEDFKGCELDLVWLSFGLLAALTVLAGLTMMYRVWRGDDD
jgi:hypothetical protein